MTTRMHPLGGNGRHVRPASALNPPDDQQRHVLAPFGATLARFRRSADMTQEELAAKISFSVSHIRKLEQGKRAPGARFVDLVSPVLDLSDDERRQLQLATQPVTTLRDGDDRWSYQAVADAARRAFDAVADKLGISRRWVYALCALTSILLLVLIALGISLTALALRSLWSSPTTSLSISEGSTVVVPGGVWLSPKNGQHFRNRLHFAARAYPTNQGDPAIAYVNFTVSWSGRPGPWLIACRVTRPSILGGFSDVYSCTWDARRARERVPAGKLHISFDVYDRAHRRNLSPNGVHAVYRLP